MRRRNPDNEKRIAAFFADFSAATRRCPFGKHGVERMFPDVPVSILFLRDEDEDYLTLGELKAHPGIRATGAGTEAMRRILDLADKHALTVLLYPSPLDAGWSRARLIRWYASFGFTFLVEDADERHDSGDYTMVRVPHSKGARRPNPRRRNPETDRALSDAQVLARKRLSDFKAKEWGIPAGWQNGAEDIRNAEAFLEWVRTAPATFRVYRALRLRDPSYLHTEGIGTYWAWKRSGANVYQDDTSGVREALRAGEGNVYLVVGEVNTQHVDWERTFFKNLYDAPWEHEIEVVEGSPIRVVGMFFVEEHGRGRDSTVNHLRAPVTARANPHRRKRSRR